MDKETLEKLFNKKCDDHEIGREAIGGFPGHEHTHPSGEQLCFRCKKSLRKILIEEYKSGYNHCLEDFKISNKFGEKSL